MLPLDWRLSPLGWRPLLLGLRPLLVGWRLSLVVFLDIHLKAVETQRDPEEFVLADYQAGEHLRFQLFDQDLPFIKDRCLQEYSVFCTLYIPLNTR